MKRYSVLVILASLLLSSCDYLTRIFCGNLVEVEQKMVDTVEKNYGKYVSVKPIPCENLYIRIYLKEDLRDTVILHSIHDELYNEKTTDGWQDMIVHDTQGRYLFTHTYSGKIFKADTGY